MSKLRDYQSQAESRPDYFNRYLYPSLLEESRRALAELVCASVEAVVLVSNATDAINTVMRNLRWNADGRDVIITFSTVYDACSKAVDFEVDYHHGLVQRWDVDLRYPMEDEHIVEKLEEAMRRIEEHGKRARLCVFDVVSSVPGVAFPWVAAVKLCRQMGVMSLVDGAQGVGMVPLDLGTADPDFFVSNCYKWLHSPRTCSLFYVPVRNQHLLRSTVATSHGYVSDSRTKNEPVASAIGMSQFVNNFSFGGTRDNATYCCIMDAIAWRKSKGGEEKIMTYIWNLNKKGARLVAEAMNTFVLDNATGTITSCGMANVALPIWIGEKGGDANEGDIALSKDEAGIAFGWMTKTIVEEFKTYLAVFAYQGRFWVRLSAQVYLGLEDYEFAAKTLKEMCERVARREYCE